MTPADIARIKALAEAARDAEAAYAASSEPGDAQVALAVAEFEIIQALHEVLTPDAALWLLALAEPPQGEFVERLFLLYLFGLNEAHASVADNEERADALADEAKTLIATLSRQHAAVVAERDAARAALRLILPLAKGYAAAHPVGSNADYVAAAEAALEAAP